MASRRVQDLIELSRFLGDPRNDLCIRAEGNASALDDGDEFLVKASGRELETIEESGFVRMRSQPVLDAFDEPDLTSQQIRQRLNDSRADQESPGVPSTEAYMHAWLLTLPDVNFVAHSHPTALLSILIADKSELIAKMRFTPDEIVLCGKASCYVPYAHPGLPLAREIRGRVEAFADEHGAQPTTIWLQNHGLIALGRTARAAASATLMTEKSARVILGALSMGYELHPLSSAQVEEIASWEDEHFRQSTVWESSDKLD